jgi:tetratricopeptide (TPR) repeat protein
MRIINWGVSALSLAMTIPMVQAQDLPLEPMLARDAAMDLYQAGEFVAAGEAYEDLLAVNPADGGYWYYLARSRSQARNCEGAIPAMQQSIALGSFGGTLRRSLVELAGCLAISGRHEEALASLRRAQIHYNFSAFEQLANDGRFGTLIETSEFQRLANPGMALTGDRDEGWRADLTYLVNLMEARHPNPFHTVSEADWRTAIEVLDRDIPVMSDVQVVGALQRLAGMIRDGHTSLYIPFGGEHAFHMLPIMPYVIGDETYILAADETHADLVGSRIIAVDGIAMEEAWGRIAEGFPHDNTQTDKITVPLALTFAETGAGLLGSDDETGLTLALEALDGSTRSVRLTGVPPNRNPVPLWAPDGWASMGPAELPMWLARKDEAHWFDDLEDINAVYAQINQTRNTDDRSLAEFASQMTAHIEATGAERLVLDIRNNMGGDGTLNMELIRAILRADNLDHEGGVFVITGPRTFSAAMIMSSMLEQMVGVIFVGEPTGSRPNFYGEDTTVVLPYSQINGSISSRWFQGGETSDDIRPWIAPDIPAELTVDDVLTGNDPALEAIYRYVATH